jgi:ribonuclease R
MMVHRLLEKYLNGGRNENRDIWEERCDHSSMREQLAANAERASIKYKQVEYMSDKIGLIFDGTISGVTEWGIYVELNENKCEGMIPVRDLGDDYYVFDDKNYCIIGKHFGKKFQLGDPITVRIKKTNLEKKQMDFSLV